MSGLDKNIHELTKMSYEEKEVGSDGRFAYIGFGYKSDKPMAVLDEDTLKELKVVADHLAQKEVVKELKGAFFFSHTPGCFLAGADIHMIQGLTSHDEAIQGSMLGQTLFNLFEDLSIPTMALVDGVCLGGGLEFALSLNKILVSDSRKVSLGLPEVKLGILPGFGGTYRLPLKVALPKALDMILSGKTLDGRKAVKLGLAHEMVSSLRLLEVAPKWLFQKPKRKSTFADSLEVMASKNFISRRMIFQKAHEGVMKVTKGHYQAPLKILEHLESSYGMSRASYLEKEARAFGELCISEQSKNLQHIFFMMEDSKKYLGKKLRASSAEGKRGGVLGAGTMGGGIAWLMAETGHRPIMKDINKTGLELGLKQAGQNFSYALERKKINAEEFENKMRSIYPTTSDAPLRQVDLVVEAIVEDMTVKKKVLSQIEKKLKKTALIASNTSSLSVKEMSEALEFPERFMGLHFFNPVHRMPLVEIVTHPKASREKVEEMLEWALHMKKTPVVVQDGPGFLVNRILMPYLNESCYLLEEGVSIKDLDAAALNFGMPMGPCRLMDEVGLDVLAKVAKVIHQGLGARAQPTKLAEKISELKFLGKKSDRGFYLYDTRGKSQSINSEVEAMLPKNETKTLTEKEIQMRIFLPMINEASYILEEKLVEGPHQVDLGLIFGTGFPPFRGGLLRYADREGLSPILSKLEEFAQTVNKDRYTPCNYLKSLVQQKRKFYDV